MNVKLLKEIIDEIDDSCVVLHSNYYIEFVSRTSCPYRITVFNSRGVNIVKVLAYSSDEDSFARQFHGDRWL